MRRRATTTPPNSATGAAALAVALAVAGTLALASPALAQTVRDPSQELRRIEADLAGGRSTKAQLDRLARDLGREIERLRTDMAETATRQQRTEETVAEVEASLSVLGHEAGEKRVVLASREMELGRLVGALQRLARRPPETLLLMGRPPLQTVRTGILLEAAIPQVNAEAELLKAELASLTQVEAEIRGQRNRLDAATARLDQDRARLAALAAEKAALLSATESRAAGTAERLRTLAESARSLRELLAGLEVERARERIEQERLASMVRPAVPPAPPAAPIAPPPVPAADPAGAAAPLPTARPERPPEAPATAQAGAGAERATASLLAMLPAAPPITTAKGRLFRPVAGAVVHRFGQRHADGLRNRGIVIAARDGSTVVAPYDGSVIYAGSFEGFGLILIIEHGEGYHTLLAGLGRIGLQAGQRVLAGEPVGSMRSRQGGGSGGGGPELYVELRHNGDPIDPLPWISGLTGKAKG